jgi:tetratricopeptide (TPR) repeat protein
VQWTVCGLFSVALLLNAASITLTDSAPATAILLNPFNSDARLKAAIGSISNDGVLLDRNYRNLIADGMKLTAADARLKSLAGFVLQGDGDLETAEKLYDESLLQLPTEQLALLRKFDLRIERRDLAEAGQIASIAIRRWPKQWTSLEPNLGVLFSDRTVLEKFSDGIRDDVVLRSRFVNSLARDSRNFALAFAVIERWHRQGVDGLDAQINAAVSRFVTEKDYASAYRLFKLTLDPKKLEGAEFLVNGDFRFKPTGSVFDWRISPVSGADISIVQTNDTDGELRFRFLDSPLLLTSPRQMLRLAPLSYRISATYSATNLKYPKPIRLEVVCGNAVVAQINFEGGSIEKSERSAEFSIPPESCPAPELRFATEKLPESWKNRYSGNLTLYRIKIEPLLKG